MKLKPLFILGLLMAIPFLAGVPYVPHAHATIGLVQSATSHCTSLTGNVVANLVFFTCNLTFGSAVTINDTVAMVAAVYNDSTATSFRFTEPEGGRCPLPCVGYSQSGPAPSTFGDGSVGGGTGADGFFEYVAALEYFVTPGSQSDFNSGNVIVGLEYSGNTNSSPLTSSIMQNFAVYAEETSGSNDSNNFATFDIGAIHPYPDHAHYFTIPSATGSAYALGVVLPLSNGIATVNATFSHTNSVGPHSTATFQYHLFGAATPSTIFAINGTSSTTNWIWAALVLGEDVPLSVPGPTVIVTKVVGCSFFSFECWMYPMMFLAMFSAFFIGVGTSFSVSEKGFMYLLLSGMTFGSIVEIQLGIMTPVVPIFLIVCNIAYSLRIDRLILGGGNAPEQ